MEKLFVYGTLQEPEVQKTVFGRVTGLREDVLPDYKKGEVVINGTTYPIAIAEAGAYVTGKVLEATPEEMR